MDSSPASERRHIVHAWFIVTACTSIIACVTAGLLVWANAHSVAPSGSIGPLDVVSTLLVISILAALLLFLSSFILVFLRRRHSAAWLVAASFVWMAVCFAGARVGNNVRMQGFERLAQRSKPLVEAIHAYERDRGQPPEQLADLGTVGKLHVTWFSDSVG